MGVFMDYRKQYQLLIDSGLNRKLKGYKENHHIIPRSIGGSNEPENMVYLTAKEHYLAHHLLHKIYPENRYIELAHRIMVMGYRQECLKFSAREFERQRKKFSDFMKSDKNPNNRPIIINGDIYFSQAEATRILNISGNTIHSRVISMSEKFKDWMYVDKNTGEPITKSVLKTTKTHKSIFIDGVKYASQVSASKILGISEKTIFRRLNLETFPTYQYPEEHFQEETLHCLGRIYSM